MNALRRFVLGALDFGGFIAPPVLALCAALALYLGSCNRDDSAFVKPRVAKHFGDAGFRVVQHQGYAFNGLGRCYWYTLERDARLYEACLMKWGDELHQYCLKGLMSVQVSGEVSP